jgi:hypothetical protein
MNDRNFLGASLGAWARGFGHPVCRRLHQALSVEVFGRRWSARWSTRGALQETAKQGGGQRWPRTRGALPLATVLALHGRGRAAFEPLHTVGYRDWPVRDKQVHVGRVAVELDHYGIALRGTRRASRSKPINRRRPSLEACTQWSRNAFQWAAVTTTFAAEEHPCKQICLYLKIGPERLHARSYFGRPRWLLPNVVARRSRGLRQIARCAGCRDRTPLSRSGRVHREQHRLIGRASDALGAQVVIDWPDPWRCEPITTRGTAS